MTMRAPSLSVRALLLLSLTRTYAIRALLMPSTPRTGGAICATLSDRPLPLTSSVSVDGAARAARAGLRPPEYAGSRRRLRGVVAGVVASPTARGAAAMNATAIYERADRLLQLRRPKEAAGLLTQLTQLTPDDGRVWMKLMSVHKRAKKLRKAEAVVRDGLRACPQNARLRQALADLCRDGRRYEEAREHFGQAMELEPSLASVYDSWGRMEAQLGQHATAASLYERGLELQPSARLCHALGVLLDTQGLAARARAVLKRGLTLRNEASNPQLLHALGMVEVRASNHAAARAHFVTSISARPSFTKAYLALGQLEERLGNKAAARRHYEAGATAKQPNGQLGAVQLWQSWARMEQRLGRPSAALALYKRAHALFPDDGQLLVEWAKLAGEHSEPALARQLFRQVVASRSRLATPYAFQCAASLELRDGKPDAARALFERGAELPADDGAARDERMPLLHAWAVFEWREGERRKARELFLAAEAAAGEDTGWLYQWHARFEADGGNAVIARHYYARAVNAAPLDSSAWRLWAEFEEQHGDAERAEVLGKHAQYVETQALLQDAAGGTRREKNPLAPADLYRK